MSHQIHWMNTRLLQSQHDLMLQMINRCSFVVFGFFACFLFCFFVFCFVFVCLFSFFFFFLFSYLWVFVYKCVNFIAVCHWLLLCCSVVCTHYSFFPLACYHCNHIALSLSLSLSLSPFSLYPLSPVGLCFVFLFVPSFFLFFLPSFFFFFFFFFLLSLSFSFLLSYSLLPPSLPSYLSYFPLSFRVFFSLHRMPFLLLLLIVAF